LGDEPVIGHASRDAKNPGGPADGGLQRPPLRAGGGYRGAAGGYSGDRDACGGSCPKVAVRPGRDRARPVRAARSVVVRPDGPVSYDASRYAAAGGLDPLEANSATYSCDNSCDNCDAGVTHVVAP
jgi:hypothetical protein